MAFTGLPAALAEAAAMNEGDAAAAARSPCERRSRAHLPPPPLAEDDRLRAGRASTEDPCVVPDAGASLMSVKKEPTSATAPTERNNCNFIGT